MRDVAPSREGLKGVVVAASNIVGTVTVRIKHNGQLQTYEMVGDADPDDELLRRCSKCGSKPGEVCMDGRKVNRTFHEERS